MYENNKDKKIKIALAQTEIVWENKTENYKRASQIVQEAADRQVEVLFFPEMSFTGFSMHTEITKEKEQETITYMKSLAQQNQIAVGFGWVKDCGDLCENHYTVIDSKGSLCSDYIKIHPFSFAGEDEKFQGGNELALYSLNGIVFSTFICYDLRFSEVFQAASRQAHVIVVAANWPASRSGHWNTLLRARALENQVYLLAVNCVGASKGSRYMGESCVIDPNGEVQAYISGTEGMVCYELTDDVWHSREVFCVQRDRRPLLYSRLKHL